MGHALIFPLLLYSQMTTTPDFRALCAEFLEVIEGEYDGTGVCIGFAFFAYELRQRARAALATPPPEPPTDEEILKLTKNISPVHLCKHKSLPSDWDFGDYACSPKGLIDIARAALERWGK